MCWSEDNFWESILAFHHVVEMSAMLHFLSHLTGWLLGCLLSLPLVSPIGVLGLQMQAAFSLGSRDQTEVVRFARLVSSPIEPSPLPLLIYFLFHFLRNYESLPGSAFWVLRSQMCTIVPILFRLSLTKLPILVSNFWAQVIPLSELPM